MPHVSYLPFEYNIRSMGTNKKDDNEDDMRAFFFFNAKKNFDIQIFI